ncbi:mannonate dehydratase (plasmid) [Burkholderia pseudomallei]|uniref:Mannonate dehydratase n=1 Tax=Burkholderia pseudomallei TaxID=28450 RepID=A0AA40MEY5_BURPE|nr:mannonate dehydratase [Burkholderia pseudomallei]AIV73671.1 mannonate dehydratase [Burkholderia pseudomallei]KGS72514.1 mannonate dehydratase [Burkholderia pseudomallei MSHR5596]KGW78505.1 mannonate dehydratase [Burkholderia pseudomallei MSHR2990]KGX17054.1 mannonate dehydratase [Burkholderia pseudomallei]
MLQSWRWFGPSDPVSLREVRQAGVSNVVTSLHHIPCGEPWPEEEIRKRIHEVEWDSMGERHSGLRWGVVESLPIHEDIKTRSGDYRHYIEVYKENIRKLGAEGVQTICYNFIPVLDWARTDLNIEQPDGSTISGCNIDAFVAFDLYILRRPGAENDYPAWMITSAAQFYAGLGRDSRDALRDAVLLGLPGTVEDLTLDDFLNRLKRYGDIDGIRLRQHLYAFLNDIMPTCEESGVKMCIHPDDPAYPVFGVPRVMSRSDDVASLFDAVPSRHSGLTMCTGSFGSCVDNNPAEMLERFADRVYFVHFRNVTHVPGKTGSFYESNHLFGSVDMPRAMRALVAEEERRRAAGVEKWEIPARPDHGKLMDGDKDSGAYPGYSRTGRMIGLAELRGLEVGIRYSMGLDIYEQ